MMDAAPKNPMRREAEHLLTLAGELAAVLPAGEAAIFQPWRDQVHGLLDNPELETLKGEQALEALSLDLRYLWLRVAHNQSARYLMSPPHSDQKVLPDKSPMGYPYDRWLKPEFLEDRLTALHPAPDGWLSEGVVLSSGMAAIHTVLQHHRAIVGELWTRPHGPVTLHWYGGYFEITRTLRMVCSAAFQARRHAQQQTLHDIVSKGAGDMVLIEPVAADINLEIFDLDAFITAWKSRSAERPCVIIVDTSLVGGTFPIHRLCTELGPNPPALVVQIRSGLKLDQEGLELGNVGLVNLYMAPGGDNQDQLHRIANSLREARTTFGTGPSHDVCAALSAPFFLSRQSLDHHASAVFANNAAFAQALSQHTGGLIKAVLHPSLVTASLVSSNDQPWAVAPYVNIRYASDDESDRNLFGRILEHEARERGPWLRAGSSFGFRAHRFELGFVRGFKFDSLRVAIGSRAGPSLNGVIQLFKDLAAYPTFAALREAYPQLAALHPVSPDDEGI